MNTLRFYRTFSYPEIWEDLFDTGLTNNIPEGFELKEKEDHKKKRLESEIKLHESNIETYKRYLSEEEEKLKSAKKELLDIT